MAAVGGLMRLRVRIMTEKWCYEEWDYLWPIYTKRYLRGERIWKRRGLL